MAAPTISLAVSQIASSQPYQGVTVSCGMAHSHYATAAEWTQSTTNTNEYYFTGGHDALSSGTMYKVRAVIQTAKGREGTVGSLDIYGFGVGDNDTLGYETVYVRTSDSTAPLDYGVGIVWDDTSTGETADNSRCTVQWWLDLDDPDTAEAVAAWPSGYRYVTDPRPGGGQIDMAGAAPNDDTGSPIRGWHYTACLPSGTLSLKCRVTNSAGESTTATQSITVGADTRTDRTVNSAGGAGYTTLTAAVTAASANDRIIVEGGHSETLAAQLNIAQEGLLIEWDGVGDMPEISHGTRCLSVRGDFVTIYGLKLNPTATGSGDAVEARNIDNLSLVSIDFAGDATNYWGDCLASFYFNSTVEQGGHLIQNCRVDMVESYVLGAGVVQRFPAREYTVIGNDFDGEGTGPSVGESTIRDTGLYNEWTIAYNAIGEDSKDGLRSNTLDHLTVYGNRLSNGVFRVGASGPAYHRTHSVRIEANWLSNNTQTSGLAMLALNAGIDGCTISGNIFDSSNSGTAGRGVGGAASPGSEIEIYPGYQLHRDILLANNTFVVNAARGENDIVKTTGQTDATHATGCVMRKNLVLTFAGFGASAIDNTNTPWTVEQNDIGEGTLDGDYLASMSVTSNDLEPGVVYDYWGNARSASTPNGAAEAGQGGDLPTPTAPMPPVRVGRRRRRGGRSRRRRL